MFLSIKYVVGESIYFEGVYVSIYLGGVYVSIYLEGVPVSIYLGASVSIYLGEVYLSIYLGGVSVDYVENLGGRNMHSVDVTINNITQAK